MHAEREKLSSAKAILAAGCTVVLWSSSFVGVRALSTEITSGALTLGRLTAASAGLTIIVLFGRWYRGKTISWPSLHDLAIVTLSGLAWFFLYNLALNQAVRFADAATVSMLVNLAPILIAVVAGLALGEGFPRRLLAGIIIACAGTTIIALASGDVSGNVTGVALGLAAAVAYAIGMLLQKPVLARVPALELTWLACLAGTLASLPFAPDLFQAVQQSPDSLLWIVFLGLGPTAIAFTTWAYALSRYTAGRMASVSYLVPVLTVALAWLVLHELPPPAALAGCALCLAGVTLATGQPTPRNLPPTAA